MIRNAAGGAPGGPSPSSHHAHDVPFFSCTRVLIGVLFAILVWIMSSPPREDPQLKTVISQLELCLNKTSALPPDLIRTLKEFHHLADASLSQITRDLTVQIHTIEVRLGNLSQNVALNLSALYEVHDALQQYVANLQLYVTPTLPDPLIVALESAWFPNAFLRMTAEGVDKVLADGGGKVNCHFGLAELEEKFKVHRMKEGSEVAFESIKNPGRFLRAVDGALTEGTPNGGGVVNAQFGIAGRGELFKLHWRAGLPWTNRALISIESQFPPGRQVRMNGEACTRTTPESSGLGAGEVNLQFGSAGGGFESFVLHIL